MSEPNTRKCDRQQPARVGEMLSDWMIGKAVARVNLGAIPGHPWQGRSLDNRHQAPQTLVTQGATPCVTRWDVLGKSIMPTNKRRIAVNLADQEYSNLAALAERHDVSMAWLGRQAILEFMEHHRLEQLPLPMRLPLPRGNRTGDTDVTRGGRP